MKEVKKEKSSGKSGISTLIDTSLFNVNGKPLKFHLEGYKQMEVFNVTKIVEAYGGELSEPTEGTLIFTEPNHPFGIRQCYDLKYLRDCIVANELLDLEKYKLPVDLNHSNVGKKSVNRKSAKGSTKNTPKYKEKYSKDEDRKIMKYIINEKEIPQTGFLHLWRKVAADKIVDRTAVSLYDHFRRKLIYEYKQHTCNFSVREEFEKILKKRNESINKVDKSVDHRGHRTKWSDEENQIVMDYIVDNNCIHRMRSGAVSREIIKNARLPDKRTARSVQDQIFKLLHWGYQKYVTDPKALREIAAIQKNK